jgi:hypothetical protein
MARIITKEKAQKIKDKLKARKITSRSAAHDEYVVEEEGVQLGIIRIRRGSEKDLGHDYVPGALSISPRQATDLANCPWTRERYVRCMREKGHLPPLPEQEEAGEDGEEDQNGQGE